MKTLPLQLSDAQFDRIVKIAELLQVPPEQFCVAKLFGALTALAGCNTFGDDVDSFEHDFALYCENGAASAGDLWEEQFPNRFYDRAGLPRPVEAEVAS